MAPIAVEPAPSTSTKGPALVIGSLSTAQDGTYQALITELEATRRVDKQLLDRLVDDGQCLSPLFGNMPGSLPIRLDSHYTRALHVFLGSCVSGAIGLRITLLKTAQLPIAGFEWAVAPGDAAPAEPRAGDRFSSFRAYPCGL